MQPVFAHKLAQATRIESESRFSDGDVKGLSQT